MSTSLKQIIPLTLALFVLLSYHFINAQWSTAPSNPPNNNIPAPINVGSGDQVKTGGISADTLSADDGLAVGILNTSDSNAQTYWRVKRNDGTGNFVSYINTEGGSTPTYETTGYAFREQFNLGNGQYRFETSQAGSAGGAITWESAMRLLPGGKVGANEYCDINGNNCTAAPLGTGGIDLQLYHIHAETSGNILNAHQACQDAGYHGIWAGMDTSGWEDLICYTSSGFVSDLPQTETFVTQFAALQSDPSFRTWYNAIGGASLPDWGEYGYRDDHGWDVRGSVQRRQDTYDMLCSYMMTNGSYHPGNAPTVADYGSDNGNAAFYYSPGSDEWVVEGHGDNGAIDAVRITCLGDAVSTQGDWWLISNRTEFPCGSHRCNPYPAPPVR